MKNALARLERLEAMNDPKENLRRLKLMFDYLKNDITPEEDFFKNGLENLRGLFD